MERILAALQWIEDVIMYGNQASLDKAMKEHSDALEALDSEAPHRPETKTK